MTYDVLTGICIGVVVVALLTVLAIEWRGGPK